MFGVGICFGAACLFVSGTAVASILNAASASKDLAVLKKEIETMNATIQQAKSLTVRIPKRMNVDRVQAVIDDAAQLNGCRLVEFQTASETPPYTSKYSTKSEVKGWTQSTVQFQLDGSFEGVFEVVRTVCSAPDPVEVDSIEVNEGRTKLFDVTAKVTLRVLTLEVKK